MLDNLHSNVCDVDRAVHGLVFNTRSLKNKQKKRLSHHSAKSLTSSCSFCHCCLWWDAPLLCHPCNLWCSYNFSPQRWVIMVKEPVHNEMVLDFLCPLCPNWSPSERPVSSFPAGRFSPTWPSLVIRQGTTEVLWSCLSKRFIVVGVSATEWSLRFYTMLTQRPGTERWMNIDEYVREGVSDGLHISWAQTLFQCCFPFLGWFSSEPSKC